MRTGAYIGSRRVDDGPGGRQVNSEPNTFWLNMANIVMGAAVLLCFLAVALAAGCAIASRYVHRRTYRRELNHDMEEMFGPPNPRRR